MDSHMVLSVWFYTNIFQTSWTRSFGANFMLMRQQFTAERNYVYEANE